MIYQGLADSTTAQGQGQGGFDGSPAVIRKQIRIGRLLRELLRIHPDCLDELPVEVQFPRDLLDDPVVVAEIKNHQAPEPLASQYLRNVP